MAPSPSDLSRALTEDNWERALAIVRSQPGQARLWSNRQGFFEGLRNATVLPLHEAVVAPQAPFAVIEAILNAYPSAAQSKESSYGRLPLHCACRRNALPAVIEKLINTFRDACLSPDNLGRLPLHYALSNGADESVVSLLLSAHPAAARGVDQRGWTPLHVACSMGASPVVIRALLTAYPEGIVMRTKKGSSPMKSLQKTCPHLQELKEILNEAKNHFDATFSHPIINRKARKPNIEEMVFV